MIHKNKFLEPNKEYKFQITALDNKDNPIGNPRTIIIKTDTEDSVNFTDYDKQNKFETSIYSAL